MMRSSIKPKRKTSEASRARAKARAQERTEAAKPSPPTANVVFLPKHGTSQIAECALWKAMGVVLGDSVDKLLRKATLPDGWKIQRTDHHMWKDLVDDQGRTRASIMHKAAFYDEDASVTIVPRFQASYQYADKMGKDSNAVYGVVTDCGKEIFRTRVFRWRPASRLNEYKQVTEEATAQAVAWLEKKGYSDFKNPLAYW